MPATALAASPAIKEAAPNLETATRTIVFPAMTADMRVKSATPPGV